MEGDGPGLETALAPHRHDRSGSVVIRSVGPGLDDFLFYGMLGALVLILAILIAFAITALFANRGK